MEGRSLPSFVFLSVDWLPIQAALAGRGREGVRITGALLAAGTPEVSLCTETQGICLAGALPGDLLQVGDTGRVTAKASYSLLVTSGAWLGGGKGCWAFGGCGVLASFKTPSGGEPL